MYLRNRHRRGAYALAPEPSWPRLLRRLIAWALVLLLIYWLFTWVLRLFGVGDAMERAPAALYTEQHGIVTVSLQKADAQAAENGMMLFPGDTYSTGPGAHAALLFFDGSWARSDEHTDVMLNESARGKNSSVSLTLSRGQMWVSTPSQQTFTGSVTRRISSADLIFTVPAGTEAVFTPTSLAVFSADGEGVAVSLKNGNPFFIGEGQQWTLPSGGAIGKEPFAFRSPLGPSAVTAFVADSRQKYLRGAMAGSGSVSSSADVLTITFPPDHYQLTDAAFTVKGTVISQVQEVLVNGHDAALDPAKHTFSQEISPSTGAGDIDLHIQALDAGKNVLADLHRTLQRPLASPQAPTVTSPASTGQTYRTNEQELVLRGKSPAGAAGMMVNDYKLQLFNPDKGEWSYLASQRLGNMKPGVNIYNVTALDANGSKSPAAQLTIIVGGGADGVVQPGDAGTTTSIGSAATASSALNPATLPKNAALEPGSLTVTGPEAGTSHTETGTGFLLEGATSAKTVTLWVNDYQLQLYKAGKKNWNYIASADFGNLKKGVNIFHIIARDQDQKILDMLNYTVTYEPAPAGFSNNRSSR